MAVELQQYNSLLRLCLLEISLCRRIDKVSTSMFPNSESSATGL